MNTQTLVYFIQKDHLFTYYHLYKYKVILQKWVFKLYKIAMNFFELLFELQNFFNSNYLQRFQIFSNHNLFDVKLSSFLEVHMSYRILKTIQTFIYYNFSEFLLRLIISINCFLISILLFVQFFLFIFIYQVS